MDRKLACWTAACVCRDESERDPARRLAWLQQAERWLALAREADGSAVVVVDGRDDMMALAPLE
jgi:hypothetical protein